VIDLVFQDLEAVLGRAIRPAARMLFDRTTRALSSRRAFVAPNAPTPLNSV